MVTRVFMILSTGINAVFSWFSSITDALPGIIGTFLAFFTMFVIYRSLILPLIGRAPISRHENRGSSSNDSVYTLGSDGYYLNGKRR